MGRQLYITRGLVFVAGIAHEPRYLKKTFESRIYLKKIPVINKEILINITNIINSTILIY